MAIVKGTNGGDTINGTNGATAGKDMIFGYGGIDHLYGEGGDDVLKGGGGADDLHGGSGSDWADYSDSNHQVEINLTTNQNYGGTAEGDTLYSIENVWGSAYDDRITGDAKDNHLVGGDGNDTLIGMGGADRLDGGDGFDMADYLYSSKGVSVSLYDGSASGGDAEGDTLIGIEGLAGSAFKDHLSGNDADNSLIGYGGDDILKGYGGADMLDGMWGDDVMVGGAGGDTYRVGEAGDQVLEFANGGYDGVYATISYTLPDNVEALFLDGKDPINATGNALDNMITGNGSANVINGAGGRDYLFGYGGADKFVWSSVDDTGHTQQTADVIEDFNFADGDRIDLSAIDANVYSNANDPFTFIGSANFTPDAANPGDVVAGQIRYYHDGINTYIELQTGHSPDVEAVICISGIVTPQASWFVL